VQACSEPGGSSRVSTARRCGRGEQAMDGGASARHETTFDEKLIPIKGFDG
jgi:hypothetical protein